MLVGIISDTHGFFDPRVEDAFRGVELILHAGDIGSPDVLTRLEKIAPVTAVAGNNDTHLAHLGLPEHVDITVAGARIHLVHRLQDARPGAGTDVVVTGHSHKALIVEKEGRLHVNPGAAGRVGFHREITVAHLRILEGRCEGEVVLLGPRLPRAQRQKQR